MQIVLPEEFESEPAALPSWVQGAAEWAVAAAIAALIFVGIMIFGGL